MAYFRGKVTLVKAVLESILMYWLSVAKIPKGILNNIRKTMFSFLWTGKKTKRRDASDQLEKDCKT